MRYLSICLLSLALLVSCKQDQVNNPQESSLNTVLNQLENEEYSDVYSTENSIVYGLNTERFETISFPSEDGPVQLETKDLNYYLVDMDPLALNGRPYALLAESAGKITETYNFEGTLALDSFLLPNFGFDPVIQRPLTNIGNALLINTGVFFQAKTPVRQSLPTLGYPRPNTGAAGSDPTPVATDASGNPCTPTYQFFGISLDGSRPTLHGKSLGGSIVSGQTRSLKPIFQARGYQSEFLEAGPDGKSIDALLNTMASKISANMCKCPPDQIVVFIAGHGYSKKYNPTGDLAMKLESPGQKDQWVTHQDLAKKLKAKLGTYGKKLNLMIYSCRSGAKFNAYKAELPGAMLITSTDSDVLCYTNFGSHVFGCLISKKVKTWDDFYNCLKKKLAKNAKKDGKTPKPKGDILR